MNYFGPFFVNLNSYPVNAYNSNYFAGPDNANLSTRGRTTVTPVARASAIVPNSVQSVLFLKPLTVTIVANNMAAYYTLDGTMPTPYDESQRYKGPVYIGVACTMNVVFVIGGQIRTAFVTFLDL